MLKTGAPGMIKRFSNADDEGMRNFYVSISKSTPLHNTVHAYARRIHNTIEELCKELQWTETMNGATDAKSSKKKQASEHAESDLEKLKMSRAKGAVATFFKTGTMKSGHKKCLISQLKAKLRDPKDERHRYYIHDSLALLKIIQKIHSLTVQKNEPNIQISFNHSKHIYHTHLDVKRFFGLAFEGYNSTMQTVAEELRSHLATLIALSYDTLPYEKNSQGHDWHMMDYRTTIAEMIKSTENSLHHLKDKSPATEHLPKTEGTEHFMPHAQQNARISASQYKCNLPGM